MTVAVIFTITPFLARISDPRPSTWASITAALVIVLVVARGYTSRTSALIRVGLVVLGVAWLAYGIWSALLHHPSTMASGIDPFAGPLRVLAVCTFFLGLSIYGIVLRMFSQRDQPFLQRFAKQRSLWIIGAALLFTSTHFLGLLEGV
jgi:hypothetical protein